MTRCPDWQFLRAAGVEDVSGTAGGGAPGGTPPGAVPIDTMRAARPSGCRENEQVPVAAGSCAASGHFPEPMFRFLRHRRSTSPGTGSPPPVHEGQRYQWISGGATWVDRRAPAARNVPNGKG